MNEQELILSIADNITWLVALCLLGGFLTGWFATYTHYRQKERERQAVETYKRQEWVKTPPKSDLQKLQDATNLLQRIVTKYHIEWEETSFDYIADTRRTDV